jgi:hypothetical protein
MLQILPFRSFAFKASWTPLDLSPVLYLDYQKSGGRNYIAANGDAKITTAVNDPFGNNDGVGDFDGTGDYLSISASTDFAMTTATIKFAINFKDLNTGYICGNYYSSGWAIYWNGSNFVLYINNSAVLSTTGFSASTGVWYEVTFVVNGASSKVYKNTTLNNTGTCGSLPNSGEFRICDASQYSDQLNCYLAYLHLQKNETNEPSLVVRPTVTSSTVLLLQLTGINNSTRFVDYANPASSGAIGGWVDLSGNYNHAYQATAASMPIRGANGITFDGSNDYLSLANKLTALDGACSVFAACKAGDVAATWRNVLGHSKSDAITPYLQMGIFGSGGDIGKAFWDASGGDGASVVGGSDITDGSGHIWTGIKQGTNAIDRFGLDGGTFGSDSKTTSLSTTNSTMIGGMRYNNTIISYWIGEIAEIIIYNSVLSTADRQKVETYLSNKYNITLS